MTATSGPGATPVLRSGPLTGLLTGLVVAFSFCLPWAAQAQQDMLLLDLPLPRSGVPAAPTEAAPDPADGDLTAPAPQAEDTVPPPQAPALPAALPPAVSGAVAAIGRLDDVLPPAGGGGSQCLPPSVAQADTVIQLTAQVLVASLVCEGEFGSQDLVQSYGDFRYANDPLIEAAEGVMAAHFTELSGEQGPDLLDTYLSTMANSESAALAQRGRRTYCDMARVRYGTVTRLNPEAFAAYVGAQAAQRLSQRPECVNLPELAPAVPTP